MRVGIPVSGFSVDPVLDRAHYLLVADTVAGRVRAQVEIPLFGRTAQERASEIASLGVNVLLCGALTDSLAKAVEAHGIDVWPMLEGQAEELLWAYCQGTLDSLRSHPDGQRRPGSAKTWSEFRRRMVTVQTPGHGVLPV